MNDEGLDLQPKEITRRLDDYIVGQAKAKRAVAVALRNRWRRRQLPAELAADVYPKNILLIGPTGCGKTEIARRLATLARAPFVKVEATKYSEVGYHGRDVESMVRDLVDARRGLVGLFAPGFGELAFAQAQRFGLPRERGAPGRFGAGGSGDRAFRRGRQWPGCSPHASLAGA
jgi:hypothetical protein